MQQSENSSEKKGEGVGGVENKDSEQSVLLRQRAEEYLRLLRRQGKQRKLSPEVEDMASLLHELAVHQVELELQAQELKRAGDELREMSERYMEYFRLAPVPIVRVGGDGVVIEANLAGQNLFREMSGTNSISLALSGLLQKNQGFLWQKFLNRVRRSKESHREEFLLRNYKGKARYFVLTGIQEKNGDVLVYFEETTELHQGSEEIERLAGVVKNTSSAVMLTDERRRITWVNEAFTKLTGYTFEEVKGKTPSFLQGPETEPLTIEKIQEKLENLEPFSCEILNYRKNGTKFWVKLEVVPLFDGQNRHVGFFGILMDITSIRSREEELLEFQNAINQSHAIILLTDLEPRIKWANQAFEDLTGYRLQEVLGKKPSILRSGEQDAEFYRNLWEKLNRNETWEGVFQNRRKDGTLFWEQASISPIFDRKGEKVGYIVVEYDITAKHKIEVAKEKTRVFLQRLVNAIPGVLCIRDSEGKFLLINEYAGLVFGLRPEEVIGKRDEDLGMPIEEAEAIRKADRMVIQTKQNMFLERDRIWTQEGWIGWFQTTKIPFEHPDSLDGAVLSLSVDVTARMEAEKRLENLNAELRQAYRQAQLALADEKKQSQFVTDLTNSIPIAIYYKDRDGNFLDCNPAASVLTGYSREELINLTIAQRDGEEVARIARQEDLDLLSGRVPILRKERWIGHKSGRKIPTIMTKAPIHDEKGNVIGIVAALMDISELKEMEEELRNATQRAQAANEAKTAFLATMSHELRTPLTSVVGTASVLAESDLPSELRGYVATICRSSQTLLELIDDILDYSKIENRKVELKKEVFNLGEALHELEEVFSCQARTRGIELRLFVDRGIPQKIVGDKGRVKQIFLNLIGNAFKFTNSGYVEVEVKFEGIREGKCGLRCFVRDTGVGLPSDQIERLFEPFTQADVSITRKYGGTGLGLAICRELVRLMGGEIVARNCVDHPGAEFEFTLWLGVGEGENVECLSKPEVTESVEIGGWDKVDKDLLKQLRVLVAEDNANNRKVMQLILLRCGVEAEFVENGLDALNKVVEKGWDLVFLDLQMPVMDGLTSARKILEHFGGKEVRPILVALTANAFAEDEKACLEAGFDYYLAKPITVSQMKSLFVRIERKLRREC